MFRLSFPSKTLNSSSVRVSKFGGIGGGGIIKGDNIGNAGVENGADVLNIAPGGGSPGGIRFANGLGPALQNN